MCRGPSEKKRICPPPLPSPPSAQNNSCPPKIVLKFKFFILLVNPSSYWYYLWKQVAGIWKLKAGTYNKAEGWYCWLTVPSEYRDWEKPLPRSFRGGERDSRLQVLRTFFLWRNRPPGMKKPVRSPHWTRRGGARQPVAGCQLGGQAKLSQARACRVWGGGQSSHCWMSLLTRQGF